MTLSAARVLLTGAAGTIGTHLRPGLAPLVGELCLLDRRPMERQVAAERAIVADVRDPAAVRDACAGMDMIIHLAAISVEAPYPDVLDVNVTGTRHVLEAARDQGCRRVVLASSNHVVGRYPVGQRIDVDAPARPDGFYGWSKAAGEALGQLYADRHGLEVVSLRIGTFAAEPAEYRHLSTWLSPRDALHLLLRCLVAPVRGHLTVFATSANDRSWWGTGGWDQLEYRPADNAEDHLESVLAKSAPFAARRHLFQGGPFAELLRMPSELRSRIIVNFPRHEAGGRRAATLGRAGGGRAGAGDPAAASDSR